MSSELEIRLVQSPEDLAVAHAIRFQVFCDEEHLHATPADQLDEKDAVSDHWVLFKNGAPIGTIRYYPPASKLGRMAVVKAAAGVGAGRLLSNELEQHVIHRRGKAQAATEGLSEVTLVASSRAKAQGFYEKLGYAAVGTHYIEDGEPHIRMVKTVQLVSV